MNMTGRGDFATLLKRQRETAGLSQEELAERAGLSVQAVSALERGTRRNPHAATVRLLADACASFDTHCAQGIEPDRERIRALVERSLMLVTALAPRLGYDRAAGIAKKAHAEGLTLKEAAVKLGYLTAEEFDREVRPESMVG